MNLDNNFENVLHVFETTCARASKMFCPSVRIAATTSTRIKRQSLQPTKKDPSDVGRRTFSTLPIMIVPFPRPFHG